MDIITYGGIDIYFQLFNAIAAITGSNNYVTFLRLIVLMGLVFVLFETVVKMDIHRSLRWFGLVFLFYSIALVPKVTVHIDDKLTNTIKAVDNVPLGVAIPASWLTQLSYQITTAIESVFHLADDDADGILSYSNTGMMMGSQLLVTASQFGITDVDFATEVENFTRQCIFYDLLLDKYTWGELASSNDIWTFVSSNASPLRMFLVDDEYQTCKAGVVELTEKWDDAIQHAAGVYGARFFGQWQSPEAAKTQLLAALPITYEFFTGMSYEAVDVMRQNMMANLIRKAVGSNASLNNASAAAQEFAIQRSDAQMRASLQISGQKAGYWLSLTRIVLEGLLFGAFVLLFPLFLLPNGLRLLKQYVVILLTLEMIPPMYAITHLIISTAAASYGASSIYDPSGSGLSLATQLGLATIHQDMAAIAGRVSLALPFITYALVAGSGYAFMQFANSVIAGPAESASNMSAGELTSGNYSYGNTSLDNENINNSSRYKHDENLNMFSGATTSNDPTGGIVTTAPDGQEIFNWNQSNLGSTIRLSESLEKSHSEGVEQSLSATDTQAQARAESMTQVMRNTLELQKVQGQSTTAGDNYSRDENVQHAQGMTQTSQMIEDFAETHHLSENQAAQIFGEASAGVSFPKWLGINAGVNARAVGMTETQYQEAFTQAQKVVESDEFQASLRAMQSAGHTENVNYSDEASQRLSDNISNSLDKAQTARTEMTRSLQEVETHREAINQIQSHRAHFDVALEQAFYKWLPQQSLGNTEKMGTNKARFMVNRDPDMLGEYMQQFISEKTNALFQENMSGKGKQAIQDNYAAGNLDSATDIQQDYIDQNSVILGEAEKDGLSPDRPIGGDLKEDIINQINNDTRAVKNRGEALTNEGATHKEEVITKTAPVGQEHPAITKLGQGLDAAQGLWDKVTGLGELKPLSDIKSDKDKAE